MGLTSATPVHQLKQQQKRHLLGVVGVSQMKLWNCLTHGKTGLYIDPDLTCPLVLFFPLYKIINT